MSHHLLTKTDSACTGHMATHLGRLPHSRPPEKYRCRQNLRLQNFRTKLLSKQYNIATSKTRRQTVQSQIRRFMSCFEIKLFSFLAFFKIEKILCSATSSVKLRKVACRNFNRFTMHVRAIRACLNGYSFCRLIRSSKSH